MAATGRGERSEGNGTECPFHAIFGCYSGVFAKWAQQITVN
jgi:hypothetical protein